MFRLHDGRISRMIVRVWRGFGQHRIGKAVEDVPEDSRGDPALLQDNRAGIGNGLIIISFTTMAGCRRGHA